MIRGLAIVAALQVLGPSARADGPSEAIGQLQRLAEHGDAQAQFDLAALYDLGRGVEQNPAEAVAWYRRAAEQGLRAAQFNLAVMLDNGRGIPRDQRQAAAWYRRAAEHGDGRAQYALALMYESGEGVPQDRDEAARWYRQAAAHGVTAAKAKLALAEARKPQRSAPPDEASSRDAVADYRRGFAYLTGSGVPKDSATAAWWFARAAGDGSGLARYALGYLYESGNGVPQDAMSAYAWYGLAAASLPSGSQRAAAVADYTRIADKLTVTQQQEAQARMLQLRQELDRQASEPPAVGQGSER